MLISCASFAQVALELYLQNVKNLCRDSPDLQEFLSTDLVERERGEGNVKVCSRFSLAVLLLGESFGR